MGMLIPVQPEEPPQACMGRQKNLIPQKKETEVSFSSIVCQAYLNSARTTLLTNCETSFTKVSRSSTKQW